jgi:uncharacterized protein YndB with AHSA1/START domain
MAKKQSTKLEGVSNDAVKKATGHGWDEWLRVLDKAGAMDWDHKQIVAFLEKNYDLSGWWQQTVTVGYEKAKGRRVVGQTADAGFQVGVQKTLAIPLDEAWNLLTSSSGIACWLGNVNRFKLQEGKTYRTDTGMEGEIRVVKPRDRVRLTWKSPGMDHPATLQIALTPSANGKTALRVHLERLPSQATRDEMKAHWRGVLEELDRSTRQER